MTKSNGQTTRVRGPCRRPGLTAASGSLSSSTCVKLGKGDWSCREIIVLEELGQVAAS